MHEFPQGANLVDGEGEDLYGGHFLEHRHIIDVLPPKVQVAHVVQIVESRLLKDLLLGEFHRRCRCPSARDFLSMPARCDSLSVSDAPTRLSAESTAAIIGTASSQGQ
mmetsp:Transcript_13816/g.24471  ORF Transcript_13816/g.24471 Transcript_13816/m.24471 type:complete len:108 (-) Transcript_13816:109-432(-)